MHFIYKHPFGEAATEIDMPEAAVSLSGFRQSQPIAKVFNDHEKTECNITNTYVVDTNDYNTQGHMKMLELISIRLYIPHLRRSVRYGSTV